MLSPDRQPATALLLAAVMLAVFPPNPADAQRSGASGRGAVSPRTPTGSILGDDEASKPQYRPGLSAEATDELVVEIRVEGNRTIPATRVTNEMQTRVGRNFDPRALANDVRKLASMPWFIDVKPLSKKTPEGRIIILRVVERPVVRYVDYLGNKSIRDSKLADETGIDIGSAVDPFNAAEGRRKIEELYVSKGYGRAQVTLIEGDKPDDQGVVYVINEGVQQKIASVSFEGNDPEFATGRRLRTKIKSKPGWVFGTFGGKLQREQLEADVQTLTDYYRQFGFYMARVGRVLEFDDDGENVDITFVINEGPRYYVRNVQFLGNEKFSESSLRSGLTLVEGEPFERTRMLVDNDWLKQLYGSQGHVFADIRAEPILLEEPGKVDLVYHIDEGDAWRVGRIFVHIGGDNPHTRIQTALNRLSLKPGDVMDIRELRASERRLQASQLFLSDPQRGVAPKISYRIPELNKTDFTASADRPDYRGQSPEGPVPLLLGGDRFWRVGAAREWLRHAAANRPRLRDAVDLHLIFDSGAEADVYEAASAAGSEAARHTAMKPPIDPHAGGDGLDWGQPVYRHASSLQSAPQSTMQSTPRSVRTAARPEYRGQSPSAYAQPAYAQPAYAPPNGTIAYGVPQAGVPTTGQSATPGQPVNQAAFVSPAVPGAAPQPAPATTADYAQPVGIPQGGQVLPAQFGGFPAPTTSPGGPAPRVIGAPTVNPNVDPTVLPIPDNGYLFPGGQFGAVGAPYPDRAVDLHVNLAEGQTGRFTLGVGVNSDAGVVGNIVLDERNFDIRRWPTSFRDFATGTAFRGAGQRLRLEAAPGSEVQRYLASFTEPYLFDTPISLQVSGSLFDRRFEDYDEQRLGGRLALGYQWVENDLSASLTYRGEKVDITDAPVGIPDLDEVVGQSNSLHGFGVRIANDTRNNPFLATEGHFVELTLEQVIGSFDYPRAIIDARKYFLLTERPDHSGRHVLSTS
ncbi:MAG: POTRA domain-containing protein, partial [Planctomycetota bacterium]